MQRRVVHRAGRALRLLGVPLGTLALAVEGRVRRLLGQDADVVRRDLRHRNAARTRCVLGDLKGGALKAGQLLATLDALFPTDAEATWQRTLADVPEHNAAVVFAQLEPVLRAELGPGWPARFAIFDERFAAAASIGQVHRAVWSDGRPVAVKIQYPDIADALRSDLRVVSLMTRTAALVAPGLALPPLVAEMRARLAEELDYHAEAAAQRAFADAYRDDPEVVIPEVVHATPRVLVTEWLHATPFVVVASEGTAAQRDRAAELYMRFLLSGPERAGRLHTDPHPGNFRLTDDGRLGVLDFGSTLAMPDGMPKTFGRLLTVLRRGDTAEVLAGLRDEGFVRPGATVDADKLADYLAPFTVPAGHETFTFTREWLRSQFSRVNDPRDPDFAVALQLTMPPEHLFTHRVWLGCVGVLCQLGATVPVRAEIERWLPGFDPT
ncbi:MAG: AarF/ABC1/UbiB kinase family protein [Actinobacteria bacterium]|nr:AarF/ABC1/UbiB kinase family protein [Actinomycetota bacterium]